MKPPVDFIRFCLIFCALCSGLNPLARVFVRIVYGTALSQGSYSSALDEFVLAGNLAPHRVIHSVQLGKVHIKLGNRDEAIMHLKVLLVKA